MAKKRKQELVASEPRNTQKKQQHVLAEKQKKEQDIKAEQAVQEYEKDEIENIEEEESDGKENGEGGEIHGTEDGENGEEDTKEDQNLANKGSSLAAAGVNQADDHDDDEDDDVPIEKLLEPFGKEQLISLLKEAAHEHIDLAKHIRNIADQDPSHRKIFVFGLGWDTTAETLINAFKIHGEIEDCKVVSDKVSRKLKGYGLILFKKRSGARRALEHPQKKIANRMARCQLASIGPVPPSGAMQPPFPTQQVSELPQRKIYVSNVGAELDPQKLTSFFAEFREIEEGPLGLDKVTVKPKGFCLFVYKTMRVPNRHLRSHSRILRATFYTAREQLMGLNFGKTLKQQPHPHPNIQSLDFQQHNMSGSAAGPGHLMVPSTWHGVVFNQGAASAASAMNPALGFGLSNLLGNIVSVAVMNEGGVPAPYGNQAHVNQGMMGTYANWGIQGSYLNQQIGQDDTGRGQHHYGFCQKKVPHGYCAFCYFIVS